MIDAYKERTVVGGVYAIRNNENGKMLLLSTTDLAGSRNRFDFSQSMGSCINMLLQQDWKKFGPGVFSFEILEQLEKKDEQSYKEFQNEIGVLLSMLLEKTPATCLYNTKKQ